VVGLVRSLPEASASPRDCRGSFRSEEDRGYVPLEEVDAAPLDFLKPLDLS